MQIETWIFVLIRRSPELPGIWSAEMPDIETAVQGRSPSLALAAADEAAHLVIIADLNSGRDPLRFMRGNEICEGRRAMMEVMVQAPQTMITPQMMDEMQAHVRALVVQMPVRASRAASDRKDCEPLTTWPERGGNGHPEL